MNIEDMLAKDGIVPRLKVDDKKQALHALAHVAEAVNGSWRGRISMRLFCNASG